jgi:hypothetical protein
MPLLRPQISRRDLTHRLGSCRLIIEPTRERGANYQHHLAQPAQETPCPGIELLSPIVGWHPTQHETQKRFSAQTSTYSFHLSGVVGVAARTEQSIKLRRRSGRPYRGRTPIISLPFTATGVRAQLWRQDTGLCRASMCLAQPCAPVMPRFVS